MPSDKYEEFIKNKRQKESEGGQVLTTSNHPVLLSELKAEDLKKAWIWEGYICKGFITLLTAPPKVGKSEFIRGFLKALEEELEFIGQPTTRTNTLVISEESEIDWVEKRDEFGFDNKLNIWVWPKPFLNKIKLKTWEQFFQEVLEFCEEHEIEFIIMDTISKYWPVDNENDATQMNDALRPTYVWAKAGIGVLLVHHDNKHGGEFGNNIRGSTAIAGFADMLISYSRLDGSNQADRKRVLKISGRFSNAEDNIVAEWQDDLTYKYIGDRYSVSKSGRIEVLLGTFKRSSEAITTQDVKRQWDTTRFGNPPSLRTIQRYILELIEKGILVVIEEKTVAGKNVPFYALKGEYIDQQKLSATEEFPPVSPLSQQGNIYLRHDSDE